MNLAIISPNQNAYSETFIRAHKSIPGVKVYFYYGGRIPVYLEGKGTLNNERYLEKRIRAIRRLTNRTGYSLQAEFFLKSLKKEKIDCILAEYGPTATSVMNICSMNSIPLIAHFHGVDAADKKILSDQMIAYKELFRHASYVIAVSRVMENKLHALGCPKEKLVYNPYGPDNSFLSVKPNFSNKLFVGIGRFVDKKAPYYTLLAFHQVVKKYPDAQLIMAGDGPLWNTCVNLSRYLNIQDKIVFPGVITPEQFRNYLQEASAFVQHSVTSENGDMEGTPVGVLEASAAGLPVISTLHAGIPDVIKNGETGLLVKEHDVNGMAANMIRILDNVDLAKKMGGAGKENIMLNFSMQKHLNTLSKIILQTTGHKAV